MVPRVRRALDPMARRLGRVEAIKGASKAKMQAPSPPGKYEWAGLESGEWGVSMQEGKRPIKISLMEQVIPEMMNRSTRGDLYYSPKAFIPRKQTHYNFLELKIQ